MLEFILSFLTVVRVETCSATIFGFKGDGYGGTTNAVALGRPVNDQDIGIAHRRWPMGTMVRVTNLRTKRVAYGVVLDTGPFGMSDQAGWFSSRQNGKMVDRAKRLLKKKGQSAYRGCADQTEKMAELTGHNGRERIRLERLKWKK